MFNLFKFGGVEKKKKSSILAEDEKTILSEIDASLVGVKGRLENLEKEIGVEEENIRHIHALGKRSVIQHVRILKELKDKHQRYSEMAARLRNTKFMILNARMTKELMETEERAARVVSSLKVDSGKFEKVLESTTEMEDEQKNIVDIIGQYNNYHYDEQTLSEELEEVLKSAGKGKAPASSEKGGSLEDMESLLERLEKKS